MTQTSWLGVVTLVSATKTPSDVATQVYVMSGEGLDAATALTEARRLATRNTPGYIEAAYFCAPLQIAWGGYGSIDSNSRVVLGPATYGSINSNSRVVLGLATTHTWYETHL